MKRLIVFLLCLLLLVFTACSRTIDNIEEELEASEERSEEEPQEAVSEESLKERVESKEESSEEEPEESWVQTDIDVPETPIPVPVPATDIDYTDQVTIDGISFDPETYLLVFTAHNLTGLEITGGGSHYRFERREGEEWKPIDIFLDFADYGDPMEPGVAREYGERLDPEWHGYEGEAGEYRLIKTFTVDARQYEKEILFQIP